jgi:hypothetical protein
MEIFFENYLEEFRVANVFSEERLDCLARFVWV